MSQQLRFSVSVPAWHWPEWPGLVWHSGKFWLNEAPARQVFNNGSLAINYHGRKISIRQLRKHAQHCSVSIENCPF